MLANAVPYVFPPPYGGGDRRGKVDKSGVDWHSHFQLRNQPADSVGQERDFLHAANREDDVHSGILLPTDLDLASLKAHYDLFNDALKLVDGMRNALVVN